jgi:3-dehydroquinate synthase
MVQRDHVPAFRVQTEQQAYEAVVERGILRRVREFIPKHTGKVFIVTTRDVWDLFGNRVQQQFDNHPLNILFFPGGEVNKRLARLEELAEQMMVAGADRTSLVIGFGGGIVTDVGGFLAAVFMRGVPVLQIPTTLLAQVDAAVGGKTGVNLRNGKNLLGSFHQPLAVLIDPEAIESLPDREYRAGLFEVIKCGVIRDPALFHLLETRADAVLLRQPDPVDELIAASIRIKAEVVSADECESGLRRILNFGHTIGHAIEAETEYVRFLHGEAIGWGMLAAVRMAQLRGMLDSGSADRIAKVICRYGPLPAANDVDPDRLIAKLASDKKTLQGKIHFVLPVSIGEVKVVSNIQTELIRQAIADTLQ